MERLQSAIEKARAQRAQRRGDGGRAGPPRPLAAPSEQADDLWQAVPDLQVKPSLLLRNRVLAFQNTAAAAPYDILRTRVIQQCRANGWRRIAVVSPHSACGKTTTVANLAFGLARQRDVRSIVMDLDLRRGGLGRVLGQTGHVPMADVLEGTVPFADIARRYGRNLIFGLSFGAAQRPAEILQSAQSAQVLEEIEAAYAPDLMVFDLPPLSASDDNLGFLTGVDAALIVVEAERTSLAQLDVAERQVADLTSVMGTVLNKSRYTSGAYGYEEGYY